MELSEIVKNGRSNCCSAPVTNSLTCKNCQESCQIERIDPNLASYKQIDVIGKVFCGAYRSGWQPFHEWAQERLKSKDARYLVDMVIGLSAWDQSEKTQEIFKNVRENLRQLGFGFEPTNQCFKCGTEIINSGSPSRCSDC